ncbi:MAG: hypothetical protein ACK5L0_04765 [Candidatus Fimivivens sp.]
MGDSTDCKAKNSNNQNCSANCIVLLKKDFVYCLIIFAIFFVLLLVLAFTNSPNAFDHFSFASTLTSIILSVIAIFMTLLNESKSDNIKSRIDASVEKVESVTDQLQKIALDVNSKFGQLEYMTSEINTQQKNLLIAINKAVSNTDEIRRQNNLISKTMTFDPTKEKEMGDGFQPYDDVTIL